MKVLLLKNQNSRDTYEAKLSAICSPVFLPLLTHTLQTAKLVKYLETHTFDILVITSQRAVECMEQVLNQLPQDDQNRILSKHIYTVGPATYDYLCKMGFRTIYGKESGNGHALSQMIVDATKNERIIYLTGEIRKDIIPDALSKHGKNWDEVSVYKTVEIAVDSQQFIDNVNHLQQATSDDWVVFFSSQGTRNLLDKVAKLKKAVIGPTTNEYLQTNGIHVDIVCHKPSAESLVQQIKEYDNL